MRWQILRAFVGWVERSEIHRERANMLGRPPAREGKSIPRRDHLGEEIMNRNGTVRRGARALAEASVALLLASSPQATSAQDVTIVRSDTQIDASDSGIKLLIREKMAQGNTRFTDDNVVLFLHGASAPSTCDFDLSYKDYSWADWMVKRGYVVYMGEYRNYGYSTREKAMDEPAAANQPVTRSYLALRDIEAMVDHIRRTRGVRQVTLIGWSWGAMMAGYYASLHSENVHKLVLYAPLYDFNDHTNLGPGSALQNK